MSLIFSLKHIAVIVKGNAGDEILDGYFMGENEWLSVFVAKVNVLNFENRFALSETVNPSRFALGSQR